MPMKETITGAEALAGRIELTNYRAEAHECLNRMRRALDKEDPFEYEHADMCFERVMKEIEALEKRLFG